VFEDEKLIFFSTNSDAYALSRYLIDGRRYLIDGKMYLIDGIRYPIDGNYPVRRYLIDGI